MGSLHRRPDPRHRDEAVSFTIGPLHDPPCLSSIGPACYTTRVTADYPDLPAGVPFSVTRLYVPAGRYAHRANGLVQLRLVRRGSSYADIDLGVGSRRVFTRPGDLMLSVPDRPTAFGIADGRELILMQLSPTHATRLLRQCGGRGL